VANLIADMSRRSAWLVNANGQNITELAKGTSSLAPNEYGIRVTLSDADGNAGVPAAMPSERAELQASPKGNYETLQWWRWVERFDANFPWVSYDRWCVCLQFHGANDGAPQAYLMWEIYQNLRRLNCNGGQKDTNYLGTWPLNAGTEVEWRMGIVWSTNPSVGRIIAIRNNVQVLDVRLRTTYAVQVPYPKLGIYRYAGINGFMGVNIWGYKLWDSDPGPFGGGDPVLAISPYPTASVQAGNTIQFTASPSATWSLNPSTGRGTITSSGLYTAPQTVPSPNNVQVTGTYSGSQGVQTKTTTVTINDATLSISPYPTASVESGGTIQFTANLPVTWSINPSPGYGSITSGGLYTAPSGLTTQTSAQVIATYQGSQGTQTRSTTVTITVPVIPTYNARRAGILLGGKMPTDPACAGRLDGFRTTGALWIADPVAPDDSGYRGWLTAARAAGCETLYWVCPTQMHAALSAGSSEDARIYGGTNQAAVFNLHPEWFWSWQTGMNPQDFTIDGVNWMTNMRPGSAWIDHFVAWAADFFANRSLHSGTTIFNGLLLHQTGNDLPVSPSNWSSTYADLWTEGCHELVRKLRTALGPDVLLVANGDWHLRRQIVWPKDISTIAVVDENNRPSMLKGGHPDLNGRMWEEMPSRSGGTQLVRAQIDKLPVTTPTALAPSGYRWAETQSGRVAIRPRFVGFDYTNPSTAQIDDYVNVGATTAPHNLGFLNGGGPGYGSYDQASIPGVVTEELINHVPNTWVYSNVDVTPPMPGSISELTNVGRTVTVAYRLPVDADRAKTTIARKASAWLYTDTYVNGTVVATLTPGAAGNAIHQQANVPAGTWYYKIFTEDAAGNINRDSNVMSINVPDVPADVTPPYAPTGIDAQVDGQVLTVTVTLIEDTDRIKTTIARKTSSWTQGQSYTQGVVIGQIFPGGLGANTVVESGLAPATYYIKAFTEDLAGNVNTTGPQVSVTISPPQLQPLGAVGGWPRRYPATARQSGRAEFSGTGTQTVFVIAHSLGVAPRRVSVSAGSAGASSDFYAVADQTQITVTYHTAPPAGSGNVVLNWEVEA
jgi:hypothetical protein